jgi:hypothetical protein
MSLDLGFYWVRWASDDEPGVTVSPIIAELAVLYRDRDPCWFLAGDEGSYSLDEFVVLSDRLVPS